MIARVSTVLVLLALGCAGQTQSSSGERGDELSDADAEGNDGHNDPSDCESHLQVLDCLTSGGYEGNQYCEIGDDGFVLTECVENQSTTGTPLVLVFDDQAVDFTHPGGSFDLFGVENPVQSAWVSARTPWLAFDRDGNGQVDDGTELFGSMTELADGRRAAHGFQALAELDEDGDGFLTSADSTFAELRLWRDLDQNRASTQDELVDLSEAGLVALEIGYDERPRCSPEGCELERARFFFRTERGMRVGALVDVHLNGRFVP